MTKVRMTKADVQDYWADPGQVPHFENAGWKRAPGQDDIEVEEWPDELKRFGGQEPVDIYNPQTGAYYTTGAESVGHHRSRGWLVVGSDDYAAAIKAKATDLDNLTVEELKDKARARDLPVSGTKAELVERLRAEPETDSDNAGDEPAQTEEA
jgi:hypothetical protein